MLHDETVMTEEARDAFECDKGCEPNRPSRVCQRRRVHCILSCTGDSLYSSLGAPEHMGFERTYSLKLGKKVAFS